MFIILSVLYLTINWTQGASFIEEPISLNISQGQKAFFSCSVQNCLGIALEE